MGDMMDGGTSPGTGGTGTPEPGAAVPRSDGPVPQPPAPPAASAAPADQGAPVPQWTPPVPARQRPKTIWGLFLVGLVTPVAAFALVAWLAQLVPSTPATAFIANGALPVLLVVPSFAAFLVLLLWARSAGRTRLASFSKGALWAYALIPLGFLLLFGACLFPGLGA